MDLVKNFKKNFDNSIYENIFDVNYESKIKLPLVYESDIPFIEELVNEVFKDNNIPPRYKIIFKDDDSDELFIYCNLDIKDNLIKALKKEGIYGEPITEFDEEVSEVEKDDLIKAKDIKTDKDGEIKLDKDTTMIIEDGEGGCDAGGSVGMTTADVAGYDAPFEIPTEYTKKQKKMMRRGQLESKKVVKEAVQIPSSAKRKGQNLIKGIEELYKISETKPNDWLQMYDENDWSFYIKDYKFNDKNMTFTWKERNGSLRADNNVSNQKEKFVANGEFDFYGEYNDFVNYWNKLVRKTKKYLEMDSTELDRKLGYDVDDEIDESKKIVKESVEDAEKIFKDILNDYDNVDETKLSHIDYEEQLTALYNRAAELYNSINKTKEEREYIWDEDNLTSLPSSLLKPQDEYSNFSPMFINFKMLINALSNLFNMRKENFKSKKIVKESINSNEEQIIDITDEMKEKYPALRNYDELIISKKWINWYDAMEFAKENNIKLPDIKEAKDIRAFLKFDNKWKQLFLIWTSEEYGEFTAVVVDSYGDTKSHGKGNTTFAKSVFLRSNNLKEFKSINESTEELLFDSFKEFVGENTFTIKDVKNYIRDLVESPDDDAMDDMAKETVEDWETYGLVKKNGMNYKFL